MSARIVTLAILLALASPARAERLITTLSTSRVLISSNFTGADVVLFGSVERDAQTVARRGVYDIVVTVTGPRETVVTYRKERVFGVWVNADSRTFVSCSSQYAATSVLTGTNSTRIGSCGRPATAYDGAMKTAARLFVIPGIITLLAACSQGERVREIDWAKFVGALMETSYDGPICIEVEDETFGKSNDGRKRAVKVARNVLAPFFAR